jgi:uncharacterized damage-inducible protein DinB
MSIFSNRFSAARHEAGDYTQALLGLLGDREPIALLEKTPAEVARRVAGLSRDDLGRPEAQHKWSIAQVVRHLADSEIVWGYRMRRILAEDRPAIHGYDQDLWADRLHYERAEADLALAELRALRLGHVRLLRALGPAERQRVGVHTERGEESVEHMIRMYAGHDLLHLNQLDRIRKTLRLEQPA